MAMTPEGKVKKEVKKILQAYNVWYHFVANNGYGNSGCPDVLVCVGGLFLAIEIKADATKQPTALQLGQLQGIEQKGGAALVVHKDNLDELRRVLETMRYTQIVRNQ